MTDTGSEQADAGTIDEILPGILRFYGMEAVIDAPSTVEVSVPFLVTVQTYGGGCEESSSTEVVLGVDVAMVAPLDRTYIPAGNACTANLKLLHHEATVAFDSAGQKTLRIEGRRVGDGLDEPLVLTRDLVAQ